MQICIWQNDNFLHAEVKKSLAWKNKNAKSYTCLWLKQSTEIIAYINSSGPTDI